MTPKPLLSVRDLRTWFPIKRGLFSKVVGHVRAVDGITLDVHAGETVGLVGESGCGKSTLGRTIVGLENSRSGTIEFDGTNPQMLQARELRTMRRDLQMIFQDPGSALNPRMTIQELVTEGMRHHQTASSAEQRENAIRTLTEVGINENALGRYPHEFSGGQRQRICIARALSVKPRMIICDESVSALDVSVQAQVINLLMELKRSRSLAYLFITHDLSVVRHIADRIAVMYLGKIVEIGPAESVMTRPQHPYTRALISAIPIPLQPRHERTVLQGEVPSAANPPSGCRFHTRCPWKVEGCTRDEPSLEHVDDSHQVACGQLGSIPRSE